MCTASLTANWNIHPELIEDWRFGESKYYIREQAAALDCQ